MMPKSQVSAEEPTPFLPAMNSPLRGLSVLRLSVLTDETTSPERQRAANRDAAAALNIALSDEHEAVDLGVSASKTTPFERPELGAWLRRPTEYDALLFWRFDRAVRSMDDMHQLSVWAREHRKMIVIAEGPGGRLVLDFRNPLDPMAQLMVTLFAFAAQFEAQAIRERVLSAQAAMRVMPLRWRGSRPPYGYEPAPLEEGGWTLVQDKQAVAVIERAIKALKDGKSAAAVAMELNAAGIASPRDHWSLRKGRKRGGKTGGAPGETVVRDRFTWRHGALKELLTSERMLGWKVVAQGPVRDDMGAPVMATTEPILTRPEFDAVCALFAERSMDNRSFRSDSVAMLLRVIVCAGCNEVMYLHRPSSKSTSKTETYKCSMYGRGVNCPAPASVKREWAEEYATRRFLDAVGRLRVTESRRIPGYDPQPEIDATTAEYEAHMQEQGQQTSNAAQNAWKRRATALDARLAELESREATPERVEIIDTGKTYTDVWHDADDTERRMLLREAGAVIRVSRAKRGKVFGLDESRLTFALREDFFADAAMELRA
ncbi:recombinase family protein [Streptomyces griseoluteus]|uniref:recombinase family protein n=1 Tax=Streptomyces griseoluteus TaxID=29306 RepID=UPI00332AA1A7